MLNWKEKEKVINDMLKTINKIDDSNYGMHHKLEYKINAIKKANTDIDYYSNSNNFVI